MRSMTERNANPPILLDIRLDVLQFVLVILASMEREVHGSEGVFLFHLCCYAKVEKLRARNGRKVGMTWAG